MNTEHKLGTHKYKCAVCGRIADKTRTDEEALQEARETFGELIEITNCEIVCSNCYQVIMTINNN